MVIHSIRELNWKRKAKETVSIAGEEGVGWDSLEVAAD